MSDIRIKVRANRTAGELEIEGPSDVVAEWWEKLWPELTQIPDSRNGRQDTGMPETAVPTNGNGQATKLFGEFFAEFRSDITDLDKVLVAAAFVQNGNPDRIFTTKSANELLVAQNVKIANASENVRRLIQNKRVFVVSNGKYRVSTIGFDHLNSVKVHA